MECIISLKTQRCKIEPRMSVKETRLEAGGQSAARPIGPPSK